MPDVNKLPKDAGPPPPVQTEMDKWWEIFGNVDATTQSVQVAVDHGKDDSFSKSVVQYYDVATDSVIFSEYDPDKPAGIGSKIAGFTSKELADTPVEDIAAILSDKVAEEIADEVFQNIGQAFKVSEEEAAAKVKAIDDFNLKMLKKEAAEMEAKGIPKKLMPPVSITNEELDQPQYDETLEKVQAMANQVYGSTPHKNENAYYKPDQKKGLKSGFLDSPKGKEEWVLEVFEQDKKNPQKQACTLYVGKNYPVINSEGSTLGWANIGQLPKHELKKVDPQQVTALQQLFDKVKKLPKSKQIEFDNKISHYFSKPGSSTQHLNTIISDWLDKQKIPTPAKSEGKTYHFSEPFTSEWMADPEEEKQFYNEQLGVPYELKPDDMLLDPVGGNKVPPSQQEQEVVKQFIDSIPSNFPELKPLGGKQFKEKKATADIPEHDSDFSDEMKAIKQELGKLERSIDVAKLEKECGGKSTPLPPQEYDAELVFEAVRHNINQITGKMLDENQDLMFKKVSDVLGETIVEERKEWRKQIQDVKRAASKECANLRGTVSELEQATKTLLERCEDLANRLDKSNDEVVKLRIENKQLRVGGGLNRSPRKVKVDNAPSDK